MADLMKFLRENPNSRKIFGKRELKIIEKQMQGINLTQSEKNRLSRDIREKLRFIKEIGRFENEFDLKKGSIVKNIIFEAKEEILSDELIDRIKKIILFGSAAENQLTFRSDIDIAVEFSEINLKEATSFRIRVAKNVNSKVDIQVYNILPGKIRKEIDEKGKVIYEQNKR